MTPAHRAPDLEVFETQGLGDASYLLASEGEALLLDPQRDAWRFLQVAQRRGWRVRHVLETHVHNDYVSGAIETRAATGAEIVAPARGGYAFAHRPADEGTELELGALRVVARATPGHTPEHLAWEVHAARSGTTDPWAVFTGGSLLVGSAGRTDLLGPERTAELCAAQFQTLRRLAALPSRTRILPTHGAGSFCVAGPTDAARVTSVAAERASNPLLGLPDAAAFELRLLGSAGRYPAYYPRMAPINRAGPPVLGGLPQVPGLSADGVAALVARGVGVVDARDRVAFAAAHVPGALNVELSSSFGAYVAWLLEFDGPIVIVVPDPVGEALEEAILQLIRIGWSRIEGVMAGGMAAWVAADRPVSSYPVATVADVAAGIASGTGPAVVDVRQPTEWRDEGEIPGAIQVFVADLPGRLDELRGRGGLDVVCKSGQRAAMAASLLDAAGIAVRLLADGGAPEVIEALQRAGRGAGPLGRP